MKYLTLSRDQQLYVALVLFLVLPLIVGLVFQYQLYGLYLEHFVRPDLEREFGFTAGSIQLPDQPGCPPQFAIISVSPEGPLGRAGMKAGDLPVGYQHGFATGFYQDLIAARHGRAVEIRVLAILDYDKGLQAWRKVRVEPTVNR